MNHTKEQLSSLLQQKLLNTPGYEDALSIVRANCTGKVWLIGGIVSRSLLEQLYHIPQTEFDFDFLVENVRDDLIIPDGWHMERAKHGNPTFYKDSLEVDLFPIETQNYLLEHHLEPTIENFFKGVSFTIQAVAFDVQKQQLIGDVGIAAIIAREYRVNNEIEARRMLAAKNMSVNDRIAQKAKSLGITPVYLESE